MMISLIVCSANEEWKENLRTNVAATIGCPYEFLSFDNSKEQLGLCRIYNQLAESAKGEYLCFCHEDIEFRTKQWGPVLCDFAQSPGVGVIGFAGVGTMQGFPYWTDRLTHQTHFIQATKERTIIADHATTDTVAEAFSPVLVLDGMLLFCRKDVWATVRFDQERFTGFHLYDTDFTFAASFSYNNYVCRRIDIIHYSQGKLSQSYFDGMLVFYNKWKSTLPKTICNLSRKKARKLIYSGIRRTCRDMILRADLSLKNAFLYFQSTKNLSNIDTLFLSLFYLMRYKLKK